MTKTIGPDIQRILDSVTREKRRTIAEFLIASLLTTALEAFTFPMLLAALSLLSDDGPPRSGRFAAIASRVSPDTAALAAFGLVVAAQLARGLCQLGAQFRAIELARFSENRVRTAVFDRVFSSAFSELQSLAVGRLTQLAVTLPREAAMYVHSRLQQLVAISMLCVYGLTAAVMLPVYAFWSAVIFGLALLAARVFLRANSRLSASIVKAQSGVYGRVTERFSMLRLIFGFGAERETGAMMSKLASDLADAASRRRRSAVAVEPAMESVMLVAAGALVLIIARTSSKGVTVLADLIFFVAMFQRASNRLYGIIERSSDIAMARASLSQVSDFLASLRPTTVPVTSTRIEVEDSIVLDRVSVEHDGAASPALLDVSLVVPRGRTVALVGHTGSGKSTILDLVGALREPTRGTVSVDGTSLSKLDGISWRKSIAVVAQDTMLLDDTVRANICFGLTDVSEERVIEAARLAGALGFIQKMPKGFDEPVGERGHRLSGGQRQLIAFARAMVRDPRVLLLDEPTSAIDAQTEQNFVEAILSASANRTVLIAAHRLSTVAHADEIIVLHTGQIVERGTHASLLALGGLYANLYGIQTLNKQSAGGTSP